MRIVALFAPREEHRVEALGNAVVASPETFFEYTWREEAEQTEEALSIAVVVPPPRPVPVILHIPLEEVRA
jgi:hypothetical protein